MEELRPSYQLASVDKLRKRLSEGKAKAVDQQNTASVLLSVVVRLSEATEYSSNDRV